MRFSTIATLSHFRISDDSEYQFETLTLSNYNPAILHRSLSDTFIKAFGDTAARQFQQGRAFAFSVANESDVAILEEASVLLNAHMKRARELLYRFDTFLWLVKDNSVLQTHIYVHTQLHGQTGFLSLDRKPIVSNAQGKFVHTSYTKAELDSAVNLRSSFYKLCPDYKDEDHWGYDREVNRIERAFKFLCSAREEMYIPAKMAMYMSCLECLFSTEAQEVTQKVCERVAFYLEETLIEREQTFNVMQIAYDIRSRYVHGSKIGTKKDKERASLEFQMKLALQVDLIVRRVMAGVIALDHANFLNEGTIATYLKRLIFRPLKMEEK